MSTHNKELENWVNEVATLTNPDSIYWCNGSQDEYENFISEMLDSGDLMKLNEESFPNCFLHRSDQSDVARVEHLTFICTNNKNDAGPNNNWLDPQEAHTKLDDLFENCMTNRTMYVIPYCMGPIDSRFS